MNHLDDTRLMRLVPKPVFADWRGRRRRAVIAAGIAVGMALTSWIVLIVASFVVVVAAPHAPAP
jgi:hypothetical protein